jgi:hypothetical protein
MRPSTYIFLATIITALLAALVRELSGQSIRRADLHDAATDLLGGFSLDIVLFVAAVVLFAVAVVMRMTGH